MLFGNPCDGPVHISAIYYPGDPDAWSRPAGNLDLAVTQKFGPTKAAAEPRVVWPGGEGIKAGTYAHFHEGVDFGDGKCGATIRAMAPGIVRVAGKDTDGALRVIIDHGGGWGTASWHLATITVKVGQHVIGGQKIGTLGKTGNASACHDHVEVREEVVWNTTGSERGFFTGKLRNIWPRLRQNVLIRPTGPGVNIRATAGTGSTPGALFAATKDDGTIRRASDNADLGPTATFRRWGGQVPGALYTIAGVRGSTWDRILLDGTWRFIASPLIVHSAS